MQNKKAANPAIPQRFQWIGDFSILYHHDRRPEPCGGHSSFPRSGKESCNDPMAQFSQHAKLSNTAGRYSCFPASNDFHHPYGQSDNVEHVRLGARARRDILCQDRAR